MRSDPADEFNDAEAERAVLSAILLDVSQSRGTYTLASLHIRARTAKRDDGAVSVDGDFADGRHNLLFVAMGAVLSRGDDLDAVSLGNEVKAMGSWNSIGGGSYLSEIIDAAVTTAHIETHARIVRREADRRRVDTVLARARRTLRESADPDRSLAATLDLVRREGIEGSVRGGPKPLGEHCDDNWRQLAERALGLSPAPMTLGLTGLDFATGGCFPGQVVTVAGVQGRGCIVTVTATTATEQFFLEQVAITATIATASGASPVTSASAPATASDMRHAFADISKEQREAWVENINRQTAIIAGLLVIGVCLFANRYERDDEDEKAV